MKKVIFILIAIVFLSCEKQLYYEFLIQRTDYILHEGEVIYTIQKPDKHLIHYGISRREADSVCEANSFESEPKRYVVSIEYFGKVYPYYIVIMKQTCKIK